MCGESGSGGGGVGPAEIAVQRTCLACRSVLPRTKLLRVTLASGRLRADAHNRAGGRGAYVCMNKACLSVACKKKGAFSRAFKANVSSEDVKDLFVEISDILNIGLDGGIIDDSKR